VQHLMTRSLTVQGRSFTTTMTDTQAIVELNEMLKAETVTSLFAADLARRALDTGLDDRGWAWVHRIVLDHRSAHRRRSMPLRVDFRAEVNQAYRRCGA
jgi:hypothetical protein